MKRNELQPFDSGLALLTIRATANTVSNEFYVIENGELLRSVLQAFVSISNTRLKRSTRVKNEQSPKSLRSIVEHSSQYRLKNGQTLQLRLLATLTNDPTILNEMILVSSTEPLNPSRKNRPDESDEIIFVTDAQEFLDWMRSRLND